MQFKDGLSAAIVGSAIAIVQFYSPTASALTAPEVSKIAKQITVRIESEFEGKKKQGSGFIVKKSNGIYYVLTARHVISDKAKYKLIAPDGRSHNLDHLKFNYKEGTDLGVVQFRSTKNYQVAKIGNSDSVFEGATVYVAGFPAKTSSVTSSNVFRFLAGQVSANATQLLAEGYSLVYTNPTLGGMSGGPVLNARGEVVGIHGKAETQAQVSEDEVKPVSTGNNLGISVNTFLRLSLLDVGLQAPPSQATTEAKADDLFLKAADLYNKKDYQGAIGALESALEVNPNYASAYHNRGVVRQELKEYNRAIEDYDRAIALDAKYASAYYNRGVVRRELKENDRAIEDYNRAIALNAIYGSQYYNRGIFDHLSPQNNPDTPSRLRQIAPNSGGGILPDRLPVNDRLNNYDPGFSVQPEHVVVYIQRGNVNRRLRKYNLALANYEQALAIDPTNANVYKNRAFIYYDLQNIDGAINDWRRAIEIDDRDYEARLGLAVALYIYGNRLEAVELWQEGANLLGRVPDLQFLKEDRSWSNIILKHAAKLLADPRF